MGGGFPNQMPVKAPVQNKISFSAFQRNDQQIQKNKLGRPSSGTQRLGSARSNKGAPNSDILPSIIRNSGSNMQDQNNSSKKNVQFNQPPSNPMDLKMI